MSVTPSQAETLAVQGSDYDVMIAEGSASTVAFLSAVLTSDPMHLGSVLLLAALYVAGLVIRLRIIQAERAPKERHDDP